MANPADDGSDILLPLSTRWEYQVVPVTEFMGVGTATQVAREMDRVMNEMADAGWELFHIGDRSSRYIGGETMLLTFRRDCTTAGMFQERVFAEERLRREVRTVIDAISDDDG